MLELRGTALREVVHLATERLLTFVDRLDDAPMIHTDGGRKLARALREPLPERPTSYRRVLGQLFERVLPVAVNTAGPGYLAYIPGGGLPYAAVADLISGITNRYVGLWFAAPGLVQLEINVIRWLCEMVGYPEGAGGVLTTGGSLANLGALVAARHDRLGEQFLDGVVYVSELAHHSVRKSARVAGFPDRNVQEVPVDEALQLDVPALKARIAEDRARGLRPAIVVATAGTTATGAVDPLPEIADLARDEGLWLHVDAAYGGFFALTARGRERLRGLERADSITLDPHKGLFLPYGTGGLLVRDLATLRRANSLSASYLPQSQQDPDAWDFAELSPELSRDARGLRVWLPLKVEGAGAFRAQLDEKWDLARLAAAQLAEVPGVRIVAPPALSLFGFVADPPSGVEANGFQRQLQARVNRRQRVMITGVDVHGRHVLRVCVLSFRTHEADVLRLVEDVRAALADLKAEPSPAG